MDTRKKSQKWVFWLGLGVGLALLSWFPWVMTLYSGVLLYFPYHEDGQSRFLRVAGPLPGIIFSNAWSYDIPKYCKVALVAAEDTGFYQHYGVERQLVEDNAKRWNQGKKVKAGGSTITQQLVKNAFLSRERTAWRKAREVVGAVVLDAIMPKDWQISWYLNIVEFAPEIYGLEAAAQHYFKKRSKELRPNECAALVAILPNPKKWGKSLHQKSMSSFLRRRYGHIVYRTDIMGLASRDDVRLAKRSGPFGEGISMPFFLGQTPDTKKTETKAEIITSGPEFPELPDDGSLAKDTLTLDGLEIKTQEPVQIDPSITEIPQVIETSPPLPQIETPLEEKGTEPIEESTPKIEQPQIQKIES